MTLTITFYIRTGAKQPSGRWNWLYMTILFWKSTRLIFWNNRDFPGFSDHRKFPSSAQRSISILEFLRNVKMGFIFPLRHEPNDGEKIIRFDCERSEINPNANLCFSGFWILLFLLFLRARDLTQFRSYLRINYPKLSQYTGWAKTMTIFNFPKSKQPLETAQLPNQKSKIWHISTKKMWHSLRPN